ncbi:MAG: flagellar hook-length control protein FliK [Candidatus Accumulibacter sp.]|jgi:hypothetical protein|nr:flagellar hook-length control protein FliK [Accumulibacter sp.]
MIPPDVVSRLQVSAEPTLRPVAQPVEISDKLSDLVPGQKVMAEIQAFLPNGTYRALINQRNVTLALPFSAKSGDVLEMFVTETNGKVAFAVAEQAAKGAESAAANLSRTGQLIARLLGGGGREGGEAPAPPALNENRPLTPSPALGRQELIPLLKQAIVQSGMFYESHQAEWVEGRFTQAALLREPQGKLSSPTAFADPQTAQAEQTTTPAQASQTAQTAQTTQAAQTAQASQSSRPDASEEAAKLAPARQDAPDEARAGARATSDRAPEQIVAQSLHTLVQQQLEALASQKFAWQGIIWPGQTMRWEIDDDEERHAAAGAEDDGAARWSTRLRMNLPELGEIDIGILVRGSNVSLSMHAAKPGTRDKMRAARGALQSQMGEAGLAIASIDIDAEMEKE